MAIPRAIVNHDMVWYEAFGWGILGNLLPVPLLLWVLEPLSRLLLAVPNPAGRFLTWRAKRLRQTQAQAVQRWGIWALALFVAVPLPATGAWTGCLLAWAFGFPRRTSFIAIAVGVVMAGGIVTGLTELTDNFPFIND